MSSVPEQPAESTGWLGNPNYIVDFDLLPVRVGTFLNDQLVAESNRAHVMFELGHAPVYYFPPDALVAEYFYKSDRQTHCPYKGIASYWHLKVGDRMVESVVWSYEDPYSQVAKIKGFRGFYWGRMDRWTEDGVTIEGPREIPGRVNTLSQLKTIFPQLAHEWHPTRNVGISPYEFAANSDTEVWWKDANGREWRERIRDRALALTRHRGDGDATPYGDFNPYP